MMNDDDKVENDKAGTKSSVSSIGVGSSGGSGCRNDTRSTF
jgi:hypothetical protein